MPWLAKAVQSMTSFAAASTPPLALFLNLSLPVSSWEFVLGKFLAGYAMIAILLGLTVYMPALIFVNGKVSLGHIFGGYLGLILLGSASIAIGPIASREPPRLLRGTVGRDAPAMGAAILPLHLNFSSSRDILLA